MIDINYKGLQMSQMSTDVYRCLWLECHKITDQVSFWFEDTGKKSTLSIFFKNIKFYWIVFLNFFAKYFFEIFIIQKHSALLHAHISKSRKIILKFFFRPLSTADTNHFFCFNQWQTLFFTFAISTNLLFLFHFLWRH